MKNIWMILFLTFIWCGFGYSFSFGYIVLGLCVSMVCCTLLPAPKTQSFHIRLIPLFVLFFFVLYELVKSSIIVAWDVITPGHLSEPKVLEVGLACQHDVERTVLANLISLTPGTLSIDLTEDKSKLKVHVMFAKNPNQAIDFIKQKLEPKVLKVFNYANTQ